MIHILDNISSNYDLQLSFMEIRVGDADYPLKVEEVKAELNLRFERINMKTSRSKKDGLLEDQVLFSVGNLKQRKCRKCGQFGHK
jgi:hypothetical protein